jgi:hypothetical protein
MTDKQIGDLREFSLNAEDAKDNAEERSWIPVRTSAKTSATSALKVRYHVFVVAVLLG